MTVGNSMNNIGRATTKIKMFSYAFVFCVSIGFLILLFVKQSIIKRKYVFVNATVKDVKCTLINDNTHECVCQVSYKSQDKVDVVSSITTHGSMKTVGESLSLMYPKGNPKHLVVRTPFGVLEYYAAIVSISTLVGFFYEYILSKSRIGRQFNAGLTAYSMLP